MTLARYPSGRRRGVILIIAIVCTAVASVMFLAIVQMAAAERNALRVEAWRQQARWLAESALDRAAARLAGDPDYQGETWNVPAAELDSPDAAVVEIEVRSVPEQPHRRVVLVRADYPDDPQHRARRSKQINVQLPPSPEGDNP